MFPIFFENSRIPVWLSNIPLVPIEINAITLGPLVFSRGIISKTTKQHEAIHWAQYKECLVILFPVLYAAFYIINLCRGMKGSTAYYEIPFEREAYKHQADPDYLDNRRLFEWVRNN